MGRGIHEKPRATLAGKGDSIPDAGHNLSYRLRDALLCTFCIFFQLPSDLVFQ